MVLNEGSHTDATTVEAGQQPTLAARTDRLETKLDAAKDVQRQIRALRPLSRDNGSRFSPCKPFVWLPILENQETM